MKTYAVIDVFLTSVKRLRAVVSFTPRPPYPRGKSLRYPLDRRLGRPQKRARRRALPGLNSDASAVFIVISSGKTCSYLTEPHALGLHKPGVARQL
jgi:hypothetical protein